MRRMRKKTRKYLSKKRTILAKAPKEDRAWSRVELDKGQCGLEGVRGKVVGRRGWEDRRGQIEQGFLSCSKKFGKLERK